MKNTKSILALLLLVLFGLTSLTGCTSTSSKLENQKNVEKTTITVAAAASLQDAANELKDIYQKKHKDINITYTFASSGTLQKQIEEGAPVDLFISAGKSQMDALAEKSLIVDSSRLDLLGNSLVLIAKKDSPLTSLEGLKDPQIKISIGTPETVPAGKYAQESLSKLNLYDAIKGKLILAKDVRQVLTYVETGNVDAGLVYNSDAINSQNIKIVLTVPEDSHKAIVYPLALIKSSKNQAPSQEFINFLKTQEARDLFRKYGFNPL